MTFEEFFKKKRIDLAALEQCEAALFSEFKTHFEQMGEKSFDYAKKYWFNKLRRQFPLAIEVKTEKPHIANPLAEQTITESLSETVIEASTPKLGFVPKFKASNMAKPTESVDDKKESPLAPPAAGETAPPPPPPKLGFVPKFKAANMPKPAESIEDKMEAPSNSPPSESVPEEKPVENSEAKPAYKPRFNMKNIPPKSSGE
jgi:hypothetical protein